MIEIENRQRNKQQKTIKFYILFKSDIYFFLSLYELIDAQTDASNK